MNFLEVDLIDAPDATKDEIRIGILHGIDISQEAAKFLTDSDRVREIRLLKQLGYEKHLRAPSQVLQEIRNYIKFGLNPDKILDKYYNKVSQKKLIKIMQTNLKTPFETNLVNVPEASLDAILYGITKGIDVSDIVAKVTELRSEIVNLLVNLKLSNIQIEPFLQDLWDRDRIIALIQGSIIIDPADLIKRYDISSNFTAGEITEIIKAHSLDPELAQLLATTDDEIPIYNQYQMFEINDGYKLGLDINQYYSPDKTDLEMKQIKDKLISVKSRHNAKFKKSVQKITRSIKLK